MSPYNDLENTGYLRKSWCDDLLWRALK